MSTTAAVRLTHWLRPEDCRLEDLLEVLQTATVLADYPTAARVEQGVLIYVAGTLRDRCADEDGRREVEAELSRAFADGPGIVVIEGAFEAGVVDRVTAAFDGLIADPARGRGDGGRPLRQAGRQRPGLERPGEAGRRATPRRSSTTTPTTWSPSRRAAWLGPGYQVTSQVNVVNPGGAGQDGAP